MHSARGNMTTIPKPAALDESLTCKYDAWNPASPRLRRPSRLVEVKDDGTVIGVYEYDGLGRRTVSKIDSQAHDETPNGPDTYRHFFYNGGWQILETRTTATVDSHPDTLASEVQYVWSLRYIDASVLRDENKVRIRDCYGDLGR